jgi:hypothetical protein
MTEPNADFDFDALVEDILQKPERLLDESLTTEQILEIQKRLNPYAGIAGPPPAAEKKRVAAVSHTNLREDYLRRFTATSMVSFLYQMLKEWEVPSDQRRWTPASAAKSTGEEFAPYASAKLAELLENAAAVAREAADVEAEAAELKRKATQASLIASDEKTESLEEAIKSGETVAAMIAEAKLTEERAAGLLYAATHVAHRVGADASARLRATAEASLRFNSVREVIGKYPLPPPPSALEAPASLAKDIIKGFLDNWLRFDPSVHVRSGHTAAAITAALAEKQVGAGTVLLDTVDTEHLPPATVAAPAVAPEAAHEAALATIKSAGPRAVSAMMTLLREPDLAEAAAAALAAREAFTCYLAPVPANSAARPAIDVVPPQDTFHRWSYYTEVNFEELRTVTEALYPERIDLDMAFALWDVFEGDEKTVNTAFDKHCQRYQDEVPSAIRALEFGAWNLLGDFKENRKKIQFYNSHTDVLKRILDRHAEDKRIGAELMRNRVRQVKAKNIAEDGADAKGLSSYKRNLAEKGQSLASKGVEPVISMEEMRRLEKARGNIKAAQELEILEQCERTISELEAAEKYRALSTNEADDLARARLAIVRAREMIEVPDDAIQVDVFTTDGTSGNITKSHFYTKADDAEEPDAMPRRPQPAAIAAAMAGSDHPAAQTSLAPFAMEYLAAVTAAERAAAEAEQAKAKAAP